MGSASSYLKVIWNICPKLTCWVLLSYPCSISPNRVSLKWTSCRGHLGPSQLSDCRRQERPSSARRYSCTHLGEAQRRSCQYDAYDVNFVWNGEERMICMYGGRQEGWSRCMADDAKCNIWRSHTTLTHIKRTQQQPTLDRKPGSIRSSPPFNTLLEINRSRQSLN